MSESGSILRTQHPSVADAVADVPSDRLVAAVRALARSTAEACGVLQHCEQAADLSVLVAKLDEAAWAAQEAEERGEQPKPSYGEAFRRARAADAWQRAARVTDQESANDAVYEALYALGAGLDAERRVIAALSA